jgi:hypothetical protein
MAKSTNSRQKARRTLQGRKAGKGGVGKREVREPRRLKKQRPGAEPRLRAGLQ